MDRKIDRGGLCWTALLRCANHMRMQQTAKTHLFATGLIAMLVMILSAPLQAHDFWIEVDPAGAPDTYRATFNIGEAAKPEPWRLRRERVVALRSYGPDGVQDQQAEIVPGEPGHATLRLAGQGTHIVTLESTPSESDLPADEFNAYVDHEGLAAVRAWREASGQAAKPGREVYARRAKTLVQIGKRLSGSVTRPVGLTLEIVPEHNPLGLKGGEDLTVRLYFQGRPLSGALLRAERLKAPHEAQGVTTDRDGRAIIILKKGGLWKLSSVWSVPIEGNPRAEFDTQFASMVFALP